MGRSDACIIIALLNEVDIADARNPSDVSIRYPFEPWITLTYIVVPAMRLAHCGFKRLRASKSVVDTPFAAAIDWHESRDTTL